MNHIYRLVLNRSTGMRQVVSEIARQSGPGAAKPRAPRWLALSAIAGAVTMLASAGVDAQTVTYTDTENNTAAITISNPILTLTSPASPGSATQSGVISGNGNVAKEGSGTLILSGANIYTGTTQINAGTLQVSTDGNLGATANAVSFDTGTLRLGTALTTTRTITVGAGGGIIDVADTTGSTFSGALNGSGTLHLINGGTSAAETTRLTLSGNGSAFTGSTQLGLNVPGNPATGRINATVTNATALGGGANTVNIYNNAELDFVGTGASAGNLHITTSISTNTLGTNSGVTFASGATAGNAVINLGGTGAAGSLVEFLNGGNAGSATITSSDNGRIMFDAGSSGGTATINATNSRINVNGASDLSQTTISNQDTNGGASGYLFVNNAATSIGQLSGNGSVVLGAQTLTVGNLNGSGTISGVISDTGPQFSDSNGNAYNPAAIATGGSLVKIGSGTLTLSGINTYSGGTTVSDGTVAVAVDQNLGATGSSVTLNGGTLSTANGFTSNRGVTLTGAGTFQVDAGSAQLGGVISGAGGLTKTGAGTLVLANNESYGGGTTISGGSLQLGNGVTNGTFNGNVVNNANLAFDAPASAIFGNQITGGGSVTVLGGQAVLLGENTYSGGTTINPGGLLQIGAGGTTGSIVGNVLNNGTLDFAHSDNPTFNGTISGTGQLQNSGVGTPMLTADNSYSGGTVIFSGGLQLGNGGTTGSIVGNVTNNGVLTVDRSNASSLPGAISGSGSLNVTGGGALTLGGANSYASGTTVTGGSAVVVSADNNLGAAGLTLDNGTLRYGAGFSSNRAITLGAGGGSIDSNGNRAELDGVIGGAGALTKTGAGTLALTGANTYSGGTTVNGGSLQVAADNNLGQAGSAVNLAGGGTLANSGAFSTARAINLGTGGGGISTAATTQIDGVLSGAGGLTKTGAGTLLLTNTNTYTGSTTISAGTLQLGNGGATGSIVGDVIDNGALVVNRSNPTTLAGTISGSGSLSQSGAGTLLLTGNNSYTGNTTIAGGSTLQLGNGGASGSIAGNVANGGTLVIDNSGASALPGVISGSGQLKQIGSGSTTVSGANSYSGGTALQGGEIIVGNSRALGTGALSMDNGTTLGFSAGNLTLANPINLTGITDPVIDTGAFTETLSGAITGSGALTKNGSGNLVLSGANSYSGATTVAAGTLSAGAANALSAVSAYTVASGATLATGGSNQTLASINNSGTVSLLGGAPGSTLTVTGAYVGNGGTLALGAALGDSGSLTDRLVLDGAGASASGKTTIQVSNLGGLGALTTGNGIDVVSAQNGATTTAQTTKDAFTLAGGHVDAGAYQYRLYAADASGAGQDWYLRSTASSSGGGGGGTGGGGSTPSQATYRAEVPMYAAEPAMVRQNDLAMLSNLHRRVGDDNAGGTSASSSDGGDMTGLARRGWARYVGSDMTIEQGGITTPKSDSNMNGVQGGVDLWTNPNWRAGVYAGYLRNDADVSGLYGLSFFNRAYAGSMRTDSTYLGGYATYTNASNQYADFVLQYGHHDITGTPIANFSADSSGSSYTASAEVGQRFPLSGGWGIEPQAQLIWNQMSLGNAWISGAVVSQDTASQVVGRLGIRVTGDYASSAGRLTPYARLNLWHGFGGTDYTSFYSPAALTSFGTSAGYTSTELAVGATLDLTPKLSVYGEIGTLFHSGGEAQVSSSVEGSLGVRLKF